jgi:hypothetical protein
MNPDDQSNMPAEDDSDAPVQLDGHMPEGMDASGDIHAENVNLSQGGAAIVHADNFTLNEGGTAFAVMSDQANVNEGSNVLLLVAGEVHGDARPLLDWRSALALAGGLVIAWRLLRRIF